MDPSNAVVPTGNPPLSNVGAAPYSQVMSPPNMAMVNVNNILNVKDSRWLQLEVCREFQRNKCTRPDTECKFAHPPPNVEVQNGRVTACYDSIKGRCNREKPPCKYFHPPQHLKDQLLINGRNHLALKNALMTQIHGITPTTSVMPGSLQMLTVDRRPSDDNFPTGTHYGGYMQPTASPYLQGIPTMAGFGPYIASSSPVMTVGVNDGMASQITGVLPQQILAAQKIPRTDRIEAFPGMGLPYKRTAGDKSGMPVYQHTGNAAYHQALMQQLGTQSYVPVSCEYGGNSSSLATSATNANVSTTETKKNPHSPDTPPPSSTTDSIPSTTSSDSTSGLSSSTTTCPSPSNALVPVLISNRSKDTTPSLTASSRSSLPSYPNVIANQPNPVLPNVFPYAGYALNKSVGVRPSAGMMQTPVGLNPHYAAAFGQNRMPAVQNQSIPFGYPNNVIASVANMVPYGGSAIQAPSMFTPAGAANAIPGMVPAAYPPNMAPVAGGFAAAASPGQYHYPSVQYPMAPYMFQSHSGAVAASPTQYAQLAAAQSLQAAAATEQPYKKMKTA